MQVLASAERPIKVRARATAIRSCLSVVESSFVDLSICCGIISNAAHRRHLVLDEQGLLDLTSVGATVGPFEKGTVDAECDLGAK